MCKYRTLRLLINNINRQPISRFHQHIQIRPIQRNPSRMIPRIRRIYTSYQSQLPVLALPMRPDLVGAEIGGVQVRLAGVEDHAVNTGLGGVRVVLDVGGEGAGGCDGEDVTVPGVVVEGVSVDGIGGLFGGEDEDGAGVGLGT